MNNSKQILIFSHNYFPNIGGAEVAIKEITERIKSARFVMITALRDRSLPREEKKGTVSIYRIGFGYGKLDQYLYPFLAPFKARKLHKEFEFDITWAMMPSQAGMAATIFHFMKREVPYLLSDQSGDSAFFWGVRTILWKPLFKQIFKHADHIQVLSKFLGDKARSMGYKGEISIIPNGVDLGHFSTASNHVLAKVLKKELNISVDEKIIITTSRLVVKNAIEIVLNAIAKLEDKRSRKKHDNGPIYKFLILGTGDFSENLKLITRMLKIEDKVLFLGDIDNDLIPRYLGISDVFTRPSRSEGQGISFIEAMAAGVPVVATPVGGIPDFLIDGETGLFAQVDNANDLADKLEMAATDKKLRERIITNAKKVVLDKYDWDILAKEMDNMFDKVILSKNR